MTAIVTTEVVSTASESTPSDVSSADPASSPQADNRTPAPRAHLARRASARPANTQPIIKQEVKKAKTSKKVFTKAPAATPAAAISPPAAAAVKKRKRAAASSTAEPSLDQASAPRKRKTRKSSSAAQSASSVTLEEPHNSAARIMDISALIETAPADLSAAEALMCMSRGDSEQFQAYEAAASTILATRYSSAQLDMRARSSEQIGRLERLAGAPSGVDPVLLARYAERCAEIRHGAAACPSRPGTLVDLDSDAEAELEAESSSDGQRRWVDGSYESVGTPPTELSQVASASTAATSPMQACPGSVDKPCSSPGSSSTSMHFV